MNEKDIRDLAHSMWESEGRPEGQSERHWKLARETILAKEHSHRSKKTSVDPSEATGPTEPEQPDQT